jgi:probable HAF family extracellular repeat protein
VIGGLGGTTSTALDVNLSGNVVGYSDTKRNGQHAFVYSGGVLSDLNAKVALGSQTLNWATGINDNGDIIGFMQYPKPISEQRGFLLRNKP